MNNITHKLRKEKHEARTLRLSYVVGFNANGFNSFNSKITVRLNRAVGAPRAAGGLTAFADGALGAILVCLNAWYSEEGCLDPGDYQAWRLAVRTDLGGNEAINYPPARGKITR